MVARQTDDAGRRITQAERRNEEWDKDRIEGWNSAPTQTQSINAKRAIDCGIGLSIEVKRQRGSIVWARRLRPPSSRLFLSLSLFFLETLQETLHGHLPFWEAAVTSKCHLTATGRAGVSQAGATSTARQGVGVGWGASSSLLPCASTLMKY